MTAPLGLQLFTVRDELATDFVDVVAKVADIGYVGVEPALDSLGTSARRAAALFEEVGLAVPSVHADLPLGENEGPVLDTTAALGCTRIVCGMGPEHYGSLGLVKQTCDVINEACAVAAASGFSLGIHNHWWEFGRVEGRFVYRVMLEHLDPRVFFQIDTYWVKTAGCDPEVVLTELGRRAPMLHIKDGPATQGEPMVPVGQGVMDFRRIIGAAGAAAEWLIVELDNAATDMMQAVELSYRYLVSEGLAQGAKPVNSYISPQGTVS